METSKEIVVDEIATADLKYGSTNLFPRTFKEYPEIARAEGPYLYDTNGNQYFDAVAGNQCSNIGHGVEEIADAAYEQIRTAEYTSSVLFTNKPAQRFAERMTDFLPDGFEHTWMVSGGSEANESAIKLAREYHTLTGNPQKHIVIGRELGFHGNTLGTLSATGMIGRKRPFIPMLAGWPKAPAAYPYRCQYCEDEATCRHEGTACAKQLEQVIRDTGPEYVSAFIAEPVVGAANAAAVPGEKYFETIREICDKYQVLLIVDEVMSGMGRTGKPFAIQHWDVTPDIITSAKGLSAGYTPLGATFPHREIAKAFAEKEDGFTHGHTYAFNPTSSAIAHAVLEYLEDNDVIANANAVGKYTRKRFEEFYDYDFVGDVRGKGLMLGIEFVEDQDTKEPLPNSGKQFRDTLFETGMHHGIATYPGGGSVDGDRGDHVLITPPLPITETHADDMIDRLHATFTDLDEFINGS